MIRRPPRPCRGSTRLSRGAGWLLALVLALLAPAAMAQGTATLVADEVFVTGDDRLVAAGNVEAYYDGTRLSAGRIVYDRASDRLTIEGPIFLQGADGEIVTAERAELDPRLENGLLRGARLVLDRQLQLAANRIDRVEGRYSQLTRAAATSCQVCAGRAPLWEIRAETVLHDQLERQLYFENATFLIRGIPVLWLPRMRLPDPTLERATGLLIPRIRSTDQLGIGLKLPYFIALGDARDLTLTPYLSRHTRTLEARYRQAFLSGDLEIRGAVTDDDIRSGDIRGYLETDGAFRLPGDYRLTFQTRSVSDPAYFLDYGYSDDDRLASDLTLERVTPGGLTRLQLTYFETLRDGETQSSLPPILVSFDREWRHALAGGMADLSASVDAFERTSDEPGEAGRDLARAGVAAGWRRDWVLPQGVLAAAEARLAFDAFNVRDDPDYASTLTRTVPSAQVTLAWPLIARDPAGGTQILEPVVALGWSDALGDTPPNEDSVLVEFDEASLLKLDRFPGDDAVESGWRLATGLTWTRMGSAGDVSRLTFGRILRESPQDGFSASSGLDGTTSDLLVAGALSFPGGFSLGARTLLDANLDFGKTSGQVIWSNPRIDLSAAYVWLPEDAGEGRGDDISEWTLAADWQVTPRWSLSLDSRYDIANDQPARTGIGIGWQNECVTVDLSVSRRYTSSTDVEPSTDFGLAVNLNGFSAGRTPAVAPGACRG